MRGWIAATAALMAMCGAGEAAAEQVCGARVHARFGETRAYFRDVLGACRPDGYCSAVVALTDDGGAAYRQQLRVARPASGAAYQVEFVAVSPMPAGDGQPMTLAFGREALGLTGSIDRSAPNAANEYRVTSDTLAVDLVNRMKKARETRWTYTSVAGVATAPFPLRGMTAALIWIDCMGARPS
ncbi:MAG: hypothetical protein IV086_02180 [Hyphomonadaceae bacterium]|nr:MAG: Uncharacterized protein FD160_1048 [Caulobacteraceae bacterium]MBT9444489.1 hypothetical protein [Hyphomonadaceae bacterium]TPW03682.1 MAG: Uncharacterized protein FD124_2904 [Alphaproteobacteria bacterium]